MMRESGYYWIVENGEWVIGEWSCAYNEWLVPHPELVSEIDERRIVRAA